MTKQPMISNKLAIRFAWGWAAVAGLITLWEIAGEALASMSQGGLIAVLTNTSFDLMPLVFLVLGALVITRKPRHTIGWLMLVPVLANMLDVFSAPFVSNVSVPPADPSWLFLLAVLADRVSWVFGVFPFLLILLLFPTGRPPSRRWNWLVLAVIGLPLLFLVLVSLGQQLWPFSEAWSVANPIGVIPNAWLSTLYSLLQVPLGVLAVVCAASLFVRYKHSSVVEQIQIKWIAFASTIFGLVYLCTILTLAATGLDWGSDNPVAVAAQLPAGLLVVAIPVVITVAILRHRLFDIEIIIRRTLVYSILTLTLGLVYVGLIVLLQELVVPLVGSSELAIVASTLVIAALFFPLRRRIQQIIDLRFYRRKYDAAKVLATFAITARDETDLQNLTNELLRVVDATVQPENVGLWLKETPGVKRGAKSI